MVSSVVAAAVLVAATGCGPDTTNGWTVGPVTTSNVRDVAVSNGFVCIIADDRTVDCWGQGSATKTDLTDEEIREENEKNTPDGQFEEIVAGSSFACARRANDELECWPSPDGSPPPLGFDPAVEQAMDIAAGGFTLCVNRRSGGVVCWNKREWPEYASGRVELPAGAEEFDAGGRVACASYPPANQARIECRVAGEPVRHWEDVPSRTDIAISTLGVGGDRVCGRVEDDGAKTRPGTSGDIVCMQHHNRDHYDHTDKHFDFSAVEKGPFAEVDATSGMHCGIRKNDHGVECWGTSTRASNDHGRAALTVPNGRFRKIDVGNFQTFCGIRTSGELACAGEGLPESFEQ